MQKRKEVKEYIYSKNNIELLQTENIKDINSFIVYSLNRVWYKCKSYTRALTYLKFPEGDVLIYPWDKDRLNKEKSLEETMLHIEHPEIEWYPMDCQPFFRQFL